MPKNKPKKEEPVEAVEPEEIDEQVLPEAGTEEKTFNFFTIKDPLLSPYEIDVDNKNFQIVRVYPNKEDPSKMMRKGMGWYTTFLGALNGIYRERHTGFHEDLNGSIVDLKTFIKYQERHKRFMLNLVKRLGIPFEMDETTGIPVISPSRFLTDCLPGSEFDTKNKKS